MQTEMIRNKTKYPVPRQAFCDKNAEQALNRFSFASVFASIAILSLRGPGSHVFALYRFLVQGDS